MSEKKWNKKSTNTEILTIDEDNREFEGKYIYTGAIEVDGNPRVVHYFKPSSGGDPVGVWGCATINHVFAEGKIDPDTECRLEFTGRKDMGKGKQPLKMIDVFTA